MNDETIPRPPGRIAVELAPEDWQRVVVILGRAAWNDVNDLIVRIAMQTQPRSQPEPPA